MSLVTQNLTEVDGAADFDKPDNMRSCTKMTVCLTISLLLAAHAQADFFSEVGSNGQSLANSLTKKGAQVRSLPSFSFFKHKSNGNLIKLHKHSSRLAEAMNLMQSSQENFLSHF